MSNLQWIDGPCPFNGPFMIHISLHAFSQNAKPLAVIHDYDEAYKTWNGVKLSGFVLSCDEAILGLHVT